MANYFGQGDAISYYMQELEEYYASLFDEDGLPIEDPDNPFDYEDEYYEEGGDIDFELDDESDEDFDYVPY